MYDIRSNLIIGFHGCDKNTAYSSVTRPDVFRISKGPYEWLGHGMYFWENNEQIAWQWSRAQLERKGLDVNEAAVIGAVIQPGYCCDLLDSRFIEILKSHYYVMEDAFNQAGKPLPVNINLTTDPHQNKLLRVLDCTVIEFMHEVIEEKLKTDISSYGFSDLKIFDSTRGVFIEGGRIYNGAEIFEKTHIQICIRNSNCIKGFFLPRKEVEF